MWENMTGKTSSGNKRKLQDFVFQKHIYIPKEAERKKFSNYTQISFDGRIIIFF